MAVANKVDICNMALDHLGKPSIVSLDEGSNEAQACLRQYDIARRMCLSRSPWTFSRKLRAIAELSENALIDRWAYHYDLPSDLVKLHSLVDAGQMPRQNALPVPSYIESGTIYTNLDAAWAFYVWDNQSTISWSSLFDDTVALFLAMRLAPQMTRRKSDTETLQGMYKVSLAEAIELDAQQEASTYVFTDGGYIDARDAGRSEYAGRQADGSTIWD